MRGGLLFGWNWTTPLPLPPFIIRFIPSSRPPFLLHLQPSSPTRHPRLLISSSSSSNSETNPNKMEAPHKTDAAQTLKESTKVEEEAKKAPVSALQPPENPLPSDCCGSGCVRCVWDIYYEELEEYNKSISDSSPKNQ